MFREKFISVVPRDFVEVTPLHSVILHLPISLLFLRLGLVVLSLAILWIRATFNTLVVTDLQTQIPFFLLLKILLDFDSISISGSQ
jgi:hypothetical protein